MNIYIYIRIFIDTYFFNGYWSNQRRPHSQQRKKRDQDIKYLLENPHQGTGSHNCSSTHSSPEELTQSSTQQSTRDSTSPDSTDTPSPSPESPEFWPRIDYLLRRRNPKRSNPVWARLSMSSPGFSKEPKARRPPTSPIDLPQELLPLLEPSPMTTDFLLFLKALKFALWSSPALPELESSRLTESAWLSISSPKLPPPVEMSSSWEALGTEKPKDISVSTPVRRTRILPLVLDAKVENGKEPEEEDDYLKTHHLQFHQPCPCIIK